MTNSSGRMRRSRFCGKRRRNNTVDFRGRCCQGAGLPLTPDELYFTFTPLTAKGPGFSSTPETLPA